MRKNFLKSNNLYIFSKKKIIFLISISIVSAILLSFFFIIKSNEFLINNSINIHKKNIFLNNEMQNSKKIIIEKDLLINHLQDKNKELNSSFNKYVDSIKFELASAEEVKKNIFSKDEEILQLNREINYYKFLINSENNKNSITVEDFSFKNNKDQENYTYSFLLLSSKNKKKLKGSFKLFYDGINKSTGKKIVKKRLNISNSNFSFVNFTKISGILKFPKNHSYNTIYLSVKCGENTYNYKHTKN